MPVVLLQVEVAICVVVFVMVGTIVVFGLLLAVLSLLQEVNKVVVFVNGGVGDDSVSVVVVVDMLAI